MKIVIILFVILFQIYKLKAGHILDSACDPITNIGASFIHMSTNTTTVVKYNDEYQKNMMEKNF